jgi:hypothetical protein
MTLKSLFEVDVIKSRWDCDEDWCLGPLVLRADFAEQKSTSSTLDVD